MEPSFGIRVAGPPKLGAGTHRISQPIQIPSGVSLRGNGAATISGGITIEHWAPVQGTPWLFEAALPADELSAGDMQVFLSRPQAPVLIRQPPFSKLHRRILVHFLGDRYRYPHLGRQRLLGVQPEQPQRWRQVA